MIGTVKETAGVVQVYDENGRYLWSRAGELVGYTSSTVSFKVAGSVQVYDERGIINIQDKEVIYCAKDFNSHSCL